MVEVERRSYPQDVTDEEWAFVLPYLLLSREDNGSRKHSLRELFNGVRYIVRTGNQWRYMANDLLPWPAVYQQRRRWMDAGVFEILVADVQELLRHFGGRKGQPTAVCIDSRTRQSTPESGARAGYDGAKRRKGSKVHIAVDTLGHLMALKVTAADQGDRTQVAELAEQLQEVTGNSVELAYVDQGYTGPNAAEAAQAQGIRLEVVKHPLAKRGFVLLPKRGVVERSFAWAARFRLKFNALAKKCDVVSLVPNVAELPSSSPPDTALFVWPEFARTLGATRTPTTVITDPSGHVLWMKEGMMSEADETQAARFLQSPPAL